MRTISNYIFIFFTQKQWTTRSWVCIFKTLFNLYWSCTHKSIPLFTRRKLLAYELYMAIYFWIWPQYFKVKNVWKNYAIIGLIFISILSAKNIWETSDDKNLMLHLINVSCLLQNLVCRLFKKLVTVKWQLVSNWLISNTAVSNQSTVSYRLLALRSFWVFERGKWNEWEVQSFRKLFISRDTNTMRCFAVTQPNIFLLTSWKIYFASAALPAGQLLQTFFLYGYHK